MFFYKVKRRIAIAAKPIPNAFITLIFSAKNNIAMIAVTKKLNPLSVETMLTLPSRIEEIYAINANPAIMPAIPAYSNPLRVMCFCFVNSQKTKMVMVIKIDVNKVRETGSMLLLASL